MRVFIVIFAMLPLLAYAGNLTRFTSDGCSAFPDGTYQQKQLWLSCCEAHDYSYWKGGTYKERVVADNALKHCVAQLGEPEVANIMLAGVKVGGSPHLPTKFRWGYGWPYPRGYGVLSVEELAQVKEMEK